MGHEHTSLVCGRRPEYTFWDMCNEDFIPNLDSQEKAWRYKLGCSKQEYI
jgi:hypothetical protein